MSDKRLQDLLGSVEEDGLVNVPDHHSLRSEQCPSIPVLVDMAERGLAPKVVHHVAGCRYCRLTMRASWAADDDVAPDDWAAGQAAVAAWHADSLSRTAFTLARRGARALLTVAPLPTAFPEKLRAPVAELATSLASILRRDHSTADRLRRLAFSLGSPLERRQNNMGSEFHRRMKSVVRTWAAKQEETGDIESLETARKLYLSIGERARAGQCSLRAGRLKRDAGRLDDAFMALALAILEVDDQRSLAEAQVELGRTSIAAGELDRARGWFTEAYQLYQRLGNEKVATQVANERAAIPTHANSEPVMRPSRTESENTR